MWLTPARIRELLDVVADYPDGSVYVTQLNGHSTTHYVTVHGPKKDYEYPKYIEFLIGPDAKAHIIKRTKEVERD